MANWIKYGAFFVSTSLTITGVWFWEHPNNKQIRGEDIAELFEATFERKVISSLEGDSDPDFASSNDGITNIISSVIRYSDIEQVACDTRKLITQEDPTEWTQGGFDYMTGRMLWITNSIVGDTYEPSLMGGSYNQTFSTNAYGVVSIAYSYLTNTCQDSFVTTASRIFEESNDVFTNYEYLTAPDKITNINYPVSQYVFPENDVTGINELTEYYFWPFATPYQYPHELWSWRNHTRIYVKRTNGNNLTFPLTFVSTNDLSISMVSSNEGAGYFIGKIEGYNSGNTDNTSLPFMVINAPTNDSLLTASKYIFDIAASPFNRTVTIYKPYYSTITARVIGPPLVVSPIGGGSTFDSYIVNIDTITNGLRAIEFTCSDTNTRPVYVGYAVAQGVSTPLTNQYFSVQSYIFSNSITATATTNALVSLDYEGHAQQLDDLRITTNKLYDLMTVLTNLNRTVYFAEVGALHSTNCIISNYDNADSAIVFTNQSGASLPVEYFDFGDGSTYIADFQSGATLHTQSTNEVDVGRIFYEYMEFNADKDGSVQGTAWNSETRISGTYIRDEYEHKSVALNYPSRYAVTNGYVKSVTVYALYENSIIEQPGYRGREADGYTFDISGNYWTTENLDTSIAGITISTPSDTFPDVRAVGTNRTFTGSNKAVYQKIYEVSNPTNSIIFDIPKPNVSGVGFANRFAYDFWRGTNTAAYSESYTFNYSLEYEIKISKFMIVVDWKFKHLGNGFTAVTNTPAWRQ